MKKSILALFLTGIIALSGCSPMLERDYFVSNTYNPVSSAGIGGSALRAENYQELLNAVLYMVARGEENGVVALYNYNAKDVEDHLTRACLEVVQEDPLGSYAVDYIKHDYSLIVSYYEVHLQIAYRRPPEQIASIVSVTGSSALRQELRRALVNFKTSTVLRVSYFTEDETYIRNLVTQAYYDAPSAALGKPEVTVSLYPDSGYQRIVEIGLTFPESPEVLLQRSQELKQHIASITPQLTTHTQLRDILMDNCYTVGDVQKNTAYDALLNKEANHEGLALAYQLLCDQAGLSCMTVQGELNGKPHYWNIIQVRQDYRHVDLSAGLFSVTDEELTSAGAYTWDSTIYPTSANPNTVPSPTPTQEN